ncbi:MAG: thioredoxin family protein [Anaerolineae bacterium]|nr:thioredoxin family protein [Anaerolineae bacterium]
MQIDFLYWAECPSHPQAWQRLQDALDALAIEAEIRRVEIATDEAAARWRFPGSPTILIDGQDIDPAAENLPARLTCRLYYRDDGRPSPLPPESMIRRALAAAQAREHLSEKGN